MNNDSQSHGARVNQEKVHKRLISEDEIALIKRSIQEAYQAAKYRQPEAGQEAFIQAQMQLIRGCHKRLAALVGEQEATRIVIEINLATDAQRQPEPTRERQPLNFQQIRRARGLTARQIAEEADVPLGTEYLLEIGGEVSRNEAIDIVHALSVLVGHYYRLEEFVLCLKEEVVAYTQTFPYTPIVKQQEEG